LVFFSLRRARTCGQDREGSCFFLPCVFSCVFSPPPSFHILFCIPLCFCIPECFFFLSYYSPCCFFLL